MRTKLRNSNLKFIACFFSATFAFNAFARNPTGETASYQLDRSSARTSSLIREGTAETTVGAENTKDGKNFYEVNIHYKLRILFAGSREGDQPLNFPAIYFTDEFLTVLRQKKIYKTPQFTLEHFGRNDVNTLEGIEYKDCDHVKFTNIKIKPSATFRKLVSALRKSLKLSSDSVKDLVIDSYITNKLPAIGAVKIDISGVLSDTHFSAGFDVLKNKLSDLGVTSLKR